MAATYAMDGRNERIYPHPLKPPNYHRPSVRNTNIVNSNIQITSRNPHQKERIQVRDFANYSVSDKGGGKESKKQEFFKKVKQMDPRNGDGVPYQTLHPDDVGKQAGFKGGNA